MTKETYKESSAEVSLSVRGDRHNVFQIQRFKNDHGFYIYALENTAEGKKIFIPRFIFSRFRACVRTILDGERDKKNRQTFELSANFLNKDYFYFKSSNMDLENLIIQDIEERKGSSGYITVNRRYIGAFEKLLYNDKLQHPNDVLGEIISYHKLFQFSFVKGSKSITSDLAMRKDVLQHIERYNPNLAERILTRESEEKPLSNEKKVAVANPKNVSKTQSNLYQPKLGERFNEKNIKVDYEELFGDGKISLVSSIGSDDESSSKNTKKKSVLSEFYTPLSASEVKAFVNKKFYFELTSNESSRFRDRFMSDRASDFYLGFEMVNALFVFNKSIKTFRFPLYYTKIGIRESGRGIHIEVKQQGQIYLNHLALAHLVEKFSDSVAGIDPIDKFFKTLLAQDISIDRINDRIHLTRYLPVKEDIFDRTREILFGYQDENGKGGILGELKLKGIECDLESVYLYRSPKLQHPVEQALEKDFEQINDIAHHSIQRFYDSLLGRFLTPELQNDDEKSNVFAKTLWIPGHLPQSTRRLVEKLDAHELVLLEGPPGTGKTHTIMNLLIHCISSQQRVLIVSDQQAAIEALIEKLLDYVVENNQNSPTEQRWKDLLLSAIKIVDQVETGEQSLQELMTKLANIFKVQEPDSGLIPGSGMKPEVLEKKLNILKNKIGGLTAQIGLLLQGHMGEKTPFASRVPKKDQLKFEACGLNQFLHLILDKRSKPKELLDTFIEIRFELSKGDMLECYNFFKIPTKNFDIEVKKLNEDLKLLSRMAEKKIDSIETFEKMIEDYPRHEIIRYLESTIQAKKSSKLNPLRRLGNQFFSIFRSPFRKKLIKLMNLLQNQIALLRMSDDWSQELWSLLREVHESIRIGDSPHQALVLYQGLYGTSSRGNANFASNSSSVQGLLEQIDDLYQQQDKLVRQRFTTSLYEIVRKATVSKRTGTNRITSVMALADNLKQFKSINESGGVFEELVRNLWETFPVWIVRKQMVPFLLPCTEQSFDLVIVDEATQCRVDDAISLMFRAKKMLVVGDDRQTVLKKNSVIDDYLFKDHQLDEHLRSTQARGFKGGGSHIFELVKSIKQASVMLDEHYRCPAKIIEFSNRYVYDNELKIMQWQLPELFSSVSVDYSEQSVESSKKPTSGKFKGIEVDMFDRYLNYVARTIRQIENQTGKKINVETDVALCYFLLKNEPYVKSVKDRFLRILERGENILDGAGAALQGKERDYIFYFWDITRYNQGAFKQGDDADKRKGELNVLMSRPKKKAFHYLHRNFEQLEHNRSNIASYLWRTYLDQKDSSGVISTKQDNEIESLFANLLRIALDKSNRRSFKDIRDFVQESSLDFRRNVVVGDARKVVDLIIFPTGNSEKVVGLVDVTGFSLAENTGQSIVDYYFQLKRATPKIEPVFIFPHELINENCQTFQLLMENIERLDVEDKFSMPRKRKA